MGFLSNLADEAGKKTGKAIGNKLFGRYADDIRVGYGEIGENKESSAKAEVKKVKVEAKERRKDVKLQEQFKLKDNIRQQINEIQAMVFDTESVKANINAMMRLSSIIESADTSDIDTSWDEEKNTLQKQLLGSAQSKFNMGLELCRAIDPSDSSIVMFDNMIRRKRQKEEEKKEEEKKNNKLFAWIGIVSLVLFALLIILIYIFQ